jgi:hypothetical protein
MNRLAVSWIDVALRLEDELCEAHVLKDKLAAENRELRDMFSGLVLAIGRNAGLLNYARLELERLPERKAARRGDLLHPVASRAVVPSQ